jgi:hypothetical protein
VKGSTKQSLRSSVTPPALEEHGKLTLGEECQALESCARASGFSVQLQLHLSVGPLYSAKEKEEKRGREEALFLFL